MSGRGSAHSEVLTSPLSRREPLILVLDEIKWAPIWGSFHKSSVCCLILL